jgi:hypothetical protein
VRRLLVVLLVACGRKPLPALITELGAPHDTLDHGECELDVRVDATYKAEVWVDGKRVGVSPNRFALRYGPHDVVVRYGDARETMFPSASCLEGKSLVVRPQ